MMNPLLLPVLLGFALTVSAAEKMEGSEPPRADSADVRKEAGEFIDAATAKARQERDEFVSKAQKEMVELNKGMAELRKKAKKLGGEAKARLDRKIRNLEQELKAAEQKLADLKVSTGAKWEELKAGVSGTIDRLKLATKKTGEGER